MPANGPTIRGNPGPHVTRKETIYDPETGIAQSGVEYSGSEKGVSGLTAVFVANNAEHRLSHEDGISRVMVYTAKQAAPVLDKYEISWEMEQRSIWNHPTVKESMIAYDALAVSDADTFRKRAEDAVDSNTDDSDITDPVFAQVVAHLKAGLDGWEQEYVVLRRTRTVPPNLASPVSIAAASLIYTTAQLLLPANVLFVLPDITTLPEPDSANFQWGWRRRPSTSIIQGQSNEQTSEFLLAAWSLLFYTPAAGDADW